MAQLNIDQQAAADSFLEFLSSTTETCMVIEGKPGTGKTFLVQHLLQQLKVWKKPLTLLWNEEPKFLNNILITATTNKAAQVIADTLQVSPKTIHSLLGLKVKEDYQTGRMKLEAERSLIITDSLIVIDEGSYITEQLLGFIHKFTHNCKILILGDRYQLVMPFSVTCPIFHQGYRTAHLGINERARAVGGNDSLIVKMAAEFEGAIDGGPFPQLRADNQTITWVDGPQFRDLVHREFTRPDRDANDARIVTWSNRMTRAYNDHIREIQGLPEHFVQGEMVVAANTLIEHGIFTECQYRVTSVKEGKTAMFSLECWIVGLNNTKTVYVPKDWDYVRSLMKQIFKEKKFKQYFYCQNLLADLRSVHCSTVYKAQGSTFQRVFLDLNDIGKCTSTTDVARMLNTGISRAAQHVYLYGQLPARFLNQPSTVGGSQLCTQIQFAQLDG